uniref:DUF569 domain-containing protein n=1 Tax=Oryza meridionalis TaxID=40149 RepID=A0A0E0DXC8_9ORYZ
MERFQDRHHVWLRSREHGLYLHADLADGSSVYLHPYRATARAAWAVHVLHHFDGHMLMLHSAANGRYLAATTSPWAATAARFGLGGGNRVTLRDLDRLPMFAAGWFPIVSASGDVLLGHATDRFLRAIDRGDGNGVTVEVSDSRRPNTPWVVEAIPPIDSIPRLPNLVGIGHIARAIRFVRAERASTDGTFPHVAWACFEFTGRSLFNLRTELARRLNFAVVSDVIMCVRAGFFGRLTPLITDLPPNNVTMEIIVVTAGTIGKAHRSSMAFTGAVVVDDDAGRRGERVRGVWCRCSLALVASGETGTTSSSMWDHGPTCQRSRNCGPTCQRRGTTPLNCGRLGADAESPRAVTNSSPLAGERKKPSGAPPPPPPPPPLLADRRGKTPRAPPPPPPLLRARRREAMEQFHDGHHVWLRSRGQGTYLRADDDGRGVSMGQGRASVHAAWTVHTHHVDAGDVDILMLHSAANGRYLATGLGWTRRRLLSGNRASIVLRDLDQEVFPPACWFAIRSGWGDDVLLRHCSWRFLRADDRKWNWNRNGTGVIADMIDGRRLARWQWVMEAIPPRNSIPRPPNPSPSFGFFARRIYFRRLTHNDLLWVWIWFTGRSALHLWNQLSRRMGFEPDPNSTMCVRAGTYGRLTPLVTDLPGNNSAMVIFVLPPESLAGLGLTCPNVHAA